MSSPWPPVVRRLLIVAAIVLAIESLVLMGFAVADLAALDDGRIALGASAAVFLLVYGGSQLIAAIMLVRGRVGARGPVVASQLIQLGIAWNLRGADSDATVIPHLALVVAAAALVVLVCVVAPPVNRAIVEREEAELREQASSDDM